MQGIRYRYDLLRRQLSYVSGTCFDFIGYTPNELTEAKQPLHEFLFPKSDWPVLKSKLSRLRDTGTHLTSYQIRLKDGGLIRVFDRFTGVWDKDGGVVAVKGMVYPDEMPSRQAIRELMAYRDAINVNTIASVTDRQGNILYVNDRFCDISGYTRGELIGQNHRIVNSRFHHEVFFRNMWRVISSGKTWHGEILNRAKDGSLYWVDSVIMPILGPHGKIIRYLSIRTLINNRKQVEQEQKAHLAVLEEIAFYVAHQLRGPVCTIEGLVNLLAHDASTSGILNEDLLDRLKDTTVSLDTMTRNLSVIINKYEAEFSKNLKSTNLQKNE